MTKLVAEHLVQYLARVGVTRIFSLSGNQIMPIYDACNDVDISIVHVRHEAAAVFMADAWAQLTGQVGVALVTAAPGFTNSLGPLFSTRAAESPVLLLSGDAPISQDGSGAFQELDQVSLSTPLTKWAARLKSPKAVLVELSRAMGIAAEGRPGPVHLALPFDILKQAVEEVDLEAPQHDATPTEPSAGGPQAAEVIAGYLQSAHHPLILSGPWLGQAHNSQTLGQIRKQLGVPVICMESPRGLRDPSLGDLAGVLTETDLLVCLGKPVDFTLGFGKTPLFSPDARFVILDDDSRLIDRASQLLGERLIHSECVNIQQLCVILSGGALRTLGQHVQWTQRVNQKTGLKPGVTHVEEEGIHPALVCDAVQQHLNHRPDAILVCDGGEFGQWAQACVRTERRIINGISGAIGGSPCYGLAAALCEATSPVVVMLGDGTMGFHLAEFETAVRQGAAFVAVVGHDARWNAEVQIQRREYGPERELACDLLDTRYDRVVVAMGGHGEFVEHADELDAALQRALSSGLPACINVKIAGLAAPVIAS